MGGVFFILLSNVIFFPEDILSIIISTSILFAGIVSYAVRNKYPTIAILILTIVALMAMCYQRLTIPNTSTTLAVVIIVGFIFSVMLKGRIMWIMHGISFIILNSIFILKVDDAVTAARTYSTLYFIVIYATAVLKSSYDRIHQHLLSTNLELHEKSNEVLAQNEELLQVKDSLNALNEDLERVVNERTKKIQIQNEILLRYNYSNAHHLRGPVARLLGLASLYEIDSGLEADFIIKKMVNEAKDIDTVVRQINDLLESEDQVEK
jgi:signal transduction histidine kinase